MKKTLLLVVFVGLIVIGNAQNNPNGNTNNRANIEALKVAYITKQLNLTPEEAQAFWPLHNNYVKELMTARKNNLDKELEFEEQALNIRKKYNTEFKKVLNSEERVNDIFKADKNFNNMMRKELLNRRIKNNPAFKKRVDDFKKEKNF